MGFVYVERVLLFVIACDFVLEVLLGLVPPSARDPDRLFWW